MQLYKLTGYYQCLLGTFWHVGLSADFGTGSYTSHHGRRSFTSSRYIFEIKCFGLCITSWKYVVKNSLTSIINFLNLLEDESYISINATTSTWCSSFNYCFCLWNRNWGFVVPWLGQRILCNPSHHDVRKSNALCCHVRTYNPSQDSSFLRNSSNDASMEGNMNVLVTPYRC